MNVDQQNKEKIRIKIPAEVARIMSKWGGHNVRLAAARGALPMSGPNLVMVLFVFYHGENKELKQEALNTLQTLPAKILLSSLDQDELHPAIIDLIARLRSQDTVVTNAVVTHPNVAVKTLLFLAENSSGEVLDLLAHNDQALLKADAIRIALINNPHTDRSTKIRLGWVEPESQNKKDSVKSELESETEKENVVADDDEDGDTDEQDEESLSKYQMLQDMSVSEKIKMALTGDKEWRTLLIREPNKQVSTAVLKNPRITEGEVLAVAKNRGSSEDLIRVILLNRDWLKIYDMKKALVYHPRTPLQTAFKFMTFLSERDVRELSKSKNVTQVIVNNARRMLMSKKRS